MIELFNLIIGAGIIQGLFLSFFLYKNKRGNQRANRVLAVLLLIFSISLLHTFANIRVEIKHIPVSINVREPFQFLFGPLIYLYACQLTGSRLVFQKRGFLHFAPFPIALIITFSPLFFRNIPISYLFFPDVGIWIALLLQLIVYLLSIRKLIDNHKAKIKDNFSTIDKINLEWLKIFIDGLMILHIVYFFLLIYIVHHNSFPWFNRIIALTLSFAIYGLGYKGFSQPEIFFSSLNDNPSTCEPTGIYANPLSVAKEMKNEGRPTNSKRYERSGLSVEESEKVKAILLDFMEKGKPFLNPELTLPILAEEIGIQRNHLSQVLNDNFGKNFYDFINYYRVEAVKKALEDPKNADYTILALAFEAGFKSKATFNSVFKKFTGVTPSFYLHEIKNR